MLDKETCKLCIEKCKADYNQTMNSRYSQYQYSSGSSVSWSSVSSKQSPISNPNHNNLGSSSSSSPSYGPFHIHWGWNDTRDELWENRGLVVCPFRDEEFNWGWGMGDVELHNIYLYPPARCQYSLEHTVFTQKAYEEEL